LDSIRQEFRINRKGHRFYGGNWNNGPNNGLFNLNLNNAATNVNTNIGGRLAKGIMSRLASFIGYSRHCDCTKSADSVLRHLILRRRQK